MPAKIFYSWQSDLDARETRSFIECCLERALPRVSAVLHVDLVVDQDARSETGSPAISDVTRRKIRDAVVFVGDLSIIAQRPGGRGGLTNGCVAVEWGWAQEALGSSAMVGVINEHFGVPSDLPVDIKAHLVRVRFSWPPGTERPDGLRERVTELLAHEIEAAIRARFLRGFAHGTVELVRHLVTTSVEGRDSFKDLSVEDVCRLTELPADQALAAMEDLVAHHLASEGGWAGSGFCIRANQELFVELDPLFMGWNARDDARNVAVQLVGSPAQQIRTDELAATLDWPPRRLNPAVALLVLHDFARSSDEVPGSLPYDHVEISATVRTRALAEGRQSFPPSARTGL